MPQTNSHSSSGEIPEVEHPLPAVTAPVPIVSPIDSDYKKPAKSPAVEEKLERADFLLVMVMVIAAFILILNETLLGVALPAIMEDLRVTASTAQWSSTGFMLTMAVVTPASGFIISRFSIRHVFVGAMAVFSAGSLVAGLAPTFAFLLLGRVLQAMGTGIIMPLLMTTMMRLVPPSRIGRAMGLIGMVISAAPALGPTVSGLILSIGTWHWLFLSVLPIGLIALLVGLRLAPSSLPEGGEDQRLDVLSMVLSTIGFGGLVWGLSSLGGASSHGGGAPVNPWILVAVSAVVLVIFVARQLQLQKTASPFMDLRVFTSFPFVLTVLMSSIAMGVLLGSSVLLPLYTVNVLGMSSLETGLVLLPGGILAALMSPVVGNLADKFSPRVLVIPGAILFAAAIWLLTMFDESTSPLFVLMTYLVISGVIPFLNTPMMGMGLGSLPQHLYSYGSSAMTTVQQVSAAAATAIFVALMGIGISNHGSDGVEAQAAGVHLAFTVAACLALTAVVVALLIPRKVAKAKH